MNLWTLLLLLGATFLGPVLYAIVGGFGMHLLGGITQSTRLGFLGAVLASLSGVPVVLAMFGVEHGLRYCGVSLGWATLAVGAGGLWCAVHHARRRYMASPALVSGGCLWIAWKFASWISI